MTKLERIQHEVHKFNQQHEMYEKITADPSKTARNIASEVIEEQSEFIHFVVDGEEWEINYHQASNGVWTSNLHIYEVVE